jgi:hypothetical protein
MAERDARFQAKIQRAIDADIFLGEFGPTLRILLAAERERFELDPGRLDPEDDERLGFQRSEVVALALEVLDEWLAGMRT